MNWLFWVGVLFGGPSLDDSQPWPRYMTADEIRIVLGQQAKEWSSCLDVPDATVVVELEFSRSGQVTELELGKWVHPCWNVHLRKLTIPRQQEPNLRFRFAMLTQQGRAISFAQVEKVRRTQLPAFIHLPFGLNDAERRKILHALGLAENAVAE